MNGYGYMHFENLSQSEDYTISVSNLRWGRDAVQDLTVSVYAKDAVTLVCDESGDKGHVYSNGKKIRDSNPNTNDRENRRRRMESDSEDEDEDENELT